MNGNGTMNRRLALMASVSILGITLGAIPRGALAQEAQSTQVAASADNGQVEEVVVTARKRSEKLIDVPVAVTALTAKDIEAEGVTSLVDVAQETPGLTLDGTIGGSGRNDRSFPEYIIRGMVPSSTQNPTTTVFLDYAPVPSGQIDSVDDVERVEVLKGPQSAYFGRETFAGAINVVTKDPSDTFGGSVSGLVGSSDYTDFRGTLEGPVIPGILDVRVTLHEYARDGSYTNGAALTNAAGVQTKASADETLGDQATKSASLEAEFKPFDNFKMKVIGIYWNDDDGPSAQALITPTPGLSNCTVEGIPYFCGTAPSLPVGTPAANTAVDAGVYGFLHNTKGQDAIGPFGPSSILFTPSDLLDHYGLDRNAYHVSVAPEYAVPSLGFTIQSLTAIDKQAYAELQDLDNGDTGQYPTFFGPQSYYNWPFLIEERYRNISQDFRVVSDADQPFRWTVGASYDWYRQDSALLSGGPFGVAGYPSGSDEAKTIGGYFAFAYDFLDNFTLNFEGRYQSDKQTAFNGNSNSVLLAATYRDFLPRVSLQYKFTPDVMAYATYSEGVNPGTFNTSEEGLPASALPPGFSVEVKPEHLKNYELGVKGDFFDHKATLSADIYYDRWTDQIFLNEFTYFGPNGQADLLTADSNANSSRLEGVEVDATVRPIQQVLINLSGAVNDSSIRSGNCGSCTLGTAFGPPSIIGNQLPNTSKYQAAIGVQYSDEIAAMPGVDWFTRVDYTYKSGEYDLASDYVKTPDSNRVNLRLGVETDSFRVEAFVENVTNDNAYTNLAPTAWLANPAANDAHANTLIAGLPYLRTYGVRATYRFGETPSPSPAPAVMPPPPPAPAPAAAPMPEKQREFQVFFDFDKSNITEAAARVIQAAADVVKSGGVAHITVTGHTDTVGTAKYNQGLSERRAASVKSALVTDGVDGGEVTTVGVGKTGLLVPTKDGVREPQNRRAVIELQ